jgi:dTDP-4-dehydrorhamnose reductase
MRQLYEPLLIQYSADIVFNGHVHAYGRSKPVNNYTVGL